MNQTTAAKRLHTRVRDLEDGNAALTAERDNAKHAATVFEAAAEQAITERDRLRERLAALAAVDLARSNVMGRIAILLFGDKTNNVTDEQCIEELRLYRKAAAALNKACRQLHQWVETHSYSLDDAEFLAVYNAACDAMEMTAVERFAALLAQPEGQPR